MSSNSQKMALLEAPVNPNINMESLASSMVTDSALISQLSPIISSTTNKTTNKNSISNSDITSSGNKITIYKVKSGDTLSGIAQNFNISVNTIIWSNNIKKTDKLKLGQSLVILPISGVEHIVVSGDTLLSITEKYKGNLDEIVAYNNITPDNSLIVGSTIVIPDGEIIPGTQNTPTGSKVKDTPVKKAVAAIKAALGVKTASADVDSSNNDSESNTINSTIVTSGSNLNPSGYYIRPINGGIRTQGIHGYNGVDLADSCGTPVYASASGDIVVSKDNSGWNGGYGNYIVISHNNNTQTLYGHMRTVMVTLGEHVNQGQEIGTIGNTGRVSGTTGCHVHFEIRNGEANPF